MIVQSDFIKKIKDFGLNSYEAKIWTALLSRGISTAGELSDIAGVPRSRSYDVLESLEKKGFIVMKIGKPIKYIAVHPEAVLDRVKKRILEESDRQQKSMDELKNSKVLTELTLLHSQGIELVDPADLSGAIKGRENMYDHLDLMMRDAKNSIIIMTSAAGLGRKVDAFKKTFKKVAEKGVKIKIAAPITKDNKEIISSLKGIAEVKNITDFDARFIIIDNDKLAFMLLNDDAVHPAYDTAVWVNTKLFATAFTHLFNAAWDNTKSAK